MSQIIHMDTESVYKLSATIAACANGLEERGLAVKKQLDPTQWEGEARDGFVFQVKTCISNLSNLRDEIDNLNLALNREIDQWLQVDNNSTLEHLSENNMLTSGLGSMIGINRYILGFFIEKEIDQVFKYFGDSPKGKALVEDIASANIRFEFDDEEGNVHYIGAENGEVVSISWVDESELPVDAGGGYSDGPPPTIKILNSLQNGSAYEIRDTIAHEMQHAIDSKTGRENIDIKYQPYDEISKDYYRSLTQEEIEQYDWSNLEDAFAASCSERVKTEIAAHARGYAFNPLKQTGENVLNMDTTYTSKEYKVILNDRGYADYYEQNIRDSFLTQGISVDVDVFWNEEFNRVQVDILNSDWLIETRPTYYA